MPACDHDRVKTNLPFSLRLAIADKHDSGLIMSALFGIFSSFDIQFVLQPSFRYEENPFLSSFLQIILQNEQCGNYGNLFWKEKLILRVLSNTTQRVGEN